MAHTGKQDIQSIGNDNTDRLTNIAIIEDVENIVLSFGKYKDITLKSIY